MQKSNTGIGRYFFEGIDGVEVGVGQEHRGEAGQGHSFAESSPFRTWLSSSVFTGEQAAGEGEIRENTKSKFEAGGCDILLYLAVDSE
jgi:hypothetical protein